MDTLRRLWTGMVVDIAPGTQDLDLAAVATDAELVARLRMLRARAGKLSLRDLEFRARRAGLHLTRTTASKILNGDRAPTRDELIALVHACMVSAEDLGPWVAAWERIAGGGTHAMELNRLREQVRRRTLAQTRKDKAQLAAEVQILKEQADSLREQMIAAEQRLRSAKPKTRPSTRRALTAATLALVLLAGTTGSAVALPTFRSPLPPGCGGNIPGLNGCGGNLRGNIPDFAGEP
ncbi:helix-turn-helix domain-containing protein [Actinomadura rubrisoli]|uniref:Helix-turn-helix domain-containing protein n=1 Tax=Actinomadura rubrisoli TaxID=2530368 RepID=A0A4R5C6G0_9ACTN|nr:helix-turn-helix transcriptional regulator [Actinomadura rubrisoli]TDD93703.1 helix-turn-helix domain-containing protein [Actinomadura rubrisoli]